MEWHGMGMGMGMAMASQEAWRGQVCEVSQLASVQYDYLSVKCWGRK